eukprot:TRINITY_DN66633_c8_g1_i2.p1 TRINITY_DN66633_c8_g1~~TRINITY_DN66633_c8_g1_i2.p1  ORF type:complete len:284 (-),score=18.88 TRINITY_DN66633_c8_g1_i2:320-1171(-)
MTFAQQSLVNRMRGATVEDSSLLKEGFPAVCKLNLINEVCEKLQRVYNRPALLHNGILSVLADWLEPVRSRVDKKKFLLPSLDLRTKILNILGSLQYGDNEDDDTTAPDMSRGRVNPNVTMLDLKSTHLGKRIMVLSKSDQETDDNKAKARILVQKWSRMMFSLNDRYAEADSGGGLKWRRHKVDLTVPDTLMSVPAADEVEKEAREERYARRMNFPAPQIMDFQHAPVSEVEIKGNKPNPLVQTRNRQLAHIKSLGRSRATVRSAAMSIEGSLSTLPTGPTI